MTPGTFYVSRFSFDIYTSRLCHGCLGCYAFRISQNMNDLLEKFNEVHGVQPLNDECQIMYEKCISGLNELFEPGMFDYIEKHHPDLSLDLKRMENNLEKVWGNTIEFRNILTLYYRHNLMIIRIFKESKSLTQGN